jgi:hypothetical protein
MMMVHSIEDSCFSGSLLGQSKVAFAGELGHEVSMYFLYTNYAKLKTDQRSSVLCSIGPNVCTFSLSWSLRASFRRESLQREANKCCVVTTVHYRLVLTSDKILGNLISK